MIAFHRNAIDLLDKQSSEELLQFLLSQQNSNGGYKDRGGRSDLYYSLFGGLMIRAWSKEHRAGSREPVTRNSQLVAESGLKLKQFIDKQSCGNVSGFIEQCCLALLQKELKINRFSRITTLLILGKSFWKERYSINLSYRSFVLFLTLDAVLPFRGVLKRLSGKMLSRIEVDMHSPCSEVAAKVFLQKMLNQDGEKDQKLLKSFACESGGFKAFAHLQQADMLSTAVALFALDFAGSDLRLLKPACLDFIQQNFVDGAFLSGDGDQTADLEYTFYGLLALGVLVV
ncbi:MAG: prenyltransferase/squalene oxidase repeat-containing protein [Bacteroidota bacterium]|nr:hypothetical protein [Odoribacter sp.]MDP3641612.1 prenyltransferase/squalene oxidase repeat-containing protein [Bacteroidota bacterium]